MRRDERVNRRGHDQYRYQEKQVGGADRRREKGGSRAAATQLERHRNDEHENGSARDVVADTPNARHQYTGRPIKRYENCK
ncbi:MAG TPA: hypothetical protein VN706_18310 [Gemmatimonadaceae bacterium]|nr:hypothetical protein [Gemmatimonadaceae bacterium]